MDAKLLCVSCKRLVCYPCGEKYGQSKYEGNVSLKNGMYACGACYCYKCARVKFDSNLFCYFCEPKAHAE